MSSTLSPSHNTSPYMAASPSRPLRTHIAHRGSTVACSMHTAAAQHIHRIACKDMDMWGEIDLSTPRVFILEHGTLDSNSEPKSERQGGKYGRNTTTTTTTTLPLCDLSQCYNDRHCHCHAAQLHDHGHDHDCGCDCDKITIQR